MENEVPMIRGGRRSGLTRGNGVTTDFVYDNASRLTEIVHRKPDGTLLSSFAYTFDPAGNITEIRFANGDVAQYDYDAKDQLTAEHRRGTLNYDITFSYDPVGNRLTQTRSGDIQDHGLITYSYNASDELLTETGRNYINTYTYDPNGNTISKTTKQTIGPKNQKKEATERYVWDFENRMIGYNAPLGDSAKDSVYTYYADWWNRTQKTVHNNIERYLYDFDEILVDYNAPGNPKALYINGPIIDERLAMLRDGQLYYYLTDHLGSVRQLIDTCGTVKNSYDYEAFGTNGNSVVLISNPYRYTGGLFDSESRLYLLRWRHYGSDGGRFLSMDPLAERVWSNAKAGFGVLSAARYTYAGSNPIRARDPFGLVLRMTGGGTWVDYKDCTSMEKVIIGKAIDYAAPKVVKAYVDLTTGSPRLGTALLAVFHSASEDTRYTVASVLRPLFQLLTTSKKAIPVQCECEAKLGVAWGCTAVPEEEQAYVVKHIGRCIHICPGFITLQTKAAAKSFLHEMIHLYAGIWGEVYMWKRDYPKLTTAETLRNADSYVDFVMRY